MTTNSSPVYPSADSMGTPRSGLLLLRNAVAAYFEANAIVAIVTPVGLKYRQFTLNQTFSPTSTDNLNANRLVFIPGEFDGTNAMKSRKYGTLDRGNRNHSQVNNPRELVNWERPLTLSVWSAPLVSDSRNESENIGIAENLLENAVRAIHYSSASDITWGSVIINSPSADNGFGVELLVSATQRGPLFDLTRDYVQPNNGFTRPT